MTLSEVRELVKSQNLDGQYILCGANQWAEWISSMQMIERFTDPKIAELGFPSLFTSYERPHAYIILMADMHPDESRVSKEAPQP